MSSIILWPLTLLLSTPCAAETLQQKQSIFATMASELVVHANRLGYQVTFGETWRSEEVASYRRVRRNAERGIGIAKSLHLDRLAIDINLFRDGRYLSDSASYVELGRWWESQHVVGVEPSWGGHFRDGNHFSFEHNGRR